LGAPGSGTANALPGESYVLFGSASGFGTNIGGRQVIDIATLSASEGFIIRGDGANDQTGWRVSAGGDVNGEQGRHVGSQG